MSFCAEDIPTTELHILLLKQPRDSHCDPTSHLYLASCVGYEHDGADFPRGVTWAELAGLDLGEAEAGLDGFGLAQHKATFEKAQQA